MNSLAAQIEPEENFRAMSVFVTDDVIVVQLEDGREVKTPLSFYPKIFFASKPQRENFKLIGLGSGVHWPDLDEDLSVRGIVLGWKSPI
jgi:hypothetical protein